MKIKEEHRIRKAWIWDKTINEFIVEKIREHLSYNIDIPEIKVLNCPCGKSRIGTHFCDLDKGVFTEEELKDKEHYKVADMGGLPYPDNYFDVAISDPPWKLNYYKRFKPYYEISRVVKDGGLIFYNATWIPTSKYDEVIETYIRQDVAFGQAFVFSIIKVKKRSVS